MKSNSFAKCVLSVLLVILTFVALPPTDALAATAPSYTNIKSPE